MLIPNHYKKSEPKFVGPRLKTESGPIGITPDTEVLAKTGWIRVDQIADHKDELLTLNAKQMALVYETPVFVAIEDFSGSLIHFSTQRIDALVTAAQPLLVFNRLASGEVIQPRKHRTAADVTRWHLVPYKKFAYIDGEPVSRSAYILPEYREGSANSENELYLPKRMIPYGVWLEFLGYWIANGSYKIIKSKEGLVLRITNMEEHQYALDLFSRMGFKVNSPDDNSVSLREYAHGRVMIYSKQIYEELSKIFPGDEKRIPRWILNMSVDWLKKFYAGLMRGTGYIELNRSNSQRLTFTSIYLPYLYDVLELILKVHGVIPRIIEINSKRESSKDGIMTFFRIGVSVNDMNRYVTYGEKTELEYEGKVCQLYFDTKEPVFFLARRNRKCYWLGGSYCVDPSLPLYS